MKQWKMTPLTTNEIEPKGWLLRQLALQAAGLCGHLDEVWSDVRDSQWVGGDRDGWERVPYWLDGFIPLAWLLQDDGMKARAKRYIDAILLQQQQDGWICPCPTEARATYDIWAYLLICKVLTVYADCSGDRRVQSALSRALACLNLHLEKHTLFGWGAARWYEGLIAIKWLYTLEPQDWLLDLARKLRVEGFNYHAYYDDFRDQMPVGRWSLLTHVVNLAMSLRQDALLTGLADVVPSGYARKALACLRDHHGTAVGFFSGDECLSGTDPAQGTELCAVVEAMFSLENLLAATGDSEWGDQLEKLAYNALPAAISEDMWSHQYVQQTNQVACERLPDDHVVFRTNGPESHLFGLEPNFGCCTANFGQGWPKFALSTFMRTPDGIASAVLAPSSVALEIGGVKVRCNLETDYPFRDTLRYTVTTEAPIEFELAIRIPGFADTATVNGVVVETGGFHRIKQIWQRECQIEVKLNFEPMLTARTENRYCLWRGPLLFALPVKARWERREYVRDGVERKYPYCDYELFPESTFGYAFSEPVFVPVEHTMGDVPFSQANPPLTINARLHELDCHVDHGVLRFGEQEPTANSESQVHSMIPYGCAKLRVTEMPIRHYPR